MIVFCCAAKVGLSYEHQKMENSLSLKKRGADNSTFSR